MKDLSNVLCECWQVPNNWWARPYSHWKPVSVREHNLIFTLLSFSMIVLCLGRIPKGLLSAQMQVSPSCKGSKCNVPLSSGKWKARKSSNCSALSAMGSARTHTALRKLSLLNRGSMPRNIVALCHPGFLPLPSPILSTDILWIYMSLKHNVHSKEQWRISSSSSAPKSRGKYRISCASKLAIFSLNGRQPGSIDPLAPLHLLFSQLI